MPMKGIKDNQIIQAAERLRARLDELLTVAKGAPSKERIEALHALREIVHPDITALLSLVKARKQSLREAQKAKRTALKEVARWRYQLGLPVVEMLKRHFASSIDDPTKEDIRAYMGNSLSAHLAQELGFEWDVAAVNELLETEPADWLRERIAEWAEVSESTVRNWILMRRR